jgi:CheY-like chemotaxis protein
MEEPRRELIIGVHSMLSLEEIYDVTIANDGKEAYDIVKTSMDEGRKYDLILMDIQVGFICNVSACSILTLTDAKPRWPPKHTPHSWVRIFRTNCCAQCLRGR